ncbi:hypothetical protein QTA56_14420 [Acinetobacter sp. VNH17]|uniref:Lipoprotein n=1 Tax=Acinetobacter thutiue TaxID=2998078 RepID=A0ABT7WRV9_9GAMM|nr:hypothetical protein [Acinetobacter thutiue]MCY6413307.1 hypothetical protein [Acinetobacter thutiue]MDN0015416.1 hypothetical protein [Acinetobacter thutiue]
MFTTNRTMIMGGVLMGLLALAGCESKSKRDFNAGCQSGGQSHSTCSCVYDQLEKQYSPALMEKLGQANLYNMELPRGFDLAMIRAVQHCQSR